MGDKEEIDDGLFLSIVSRFETPSSHIEQARSVSLTSQSITIGIGIFFVYTGSELWWTISFMILGIALGILYMDVCLNIGLNNIYYRAQKEKLKTMIKTTKVQIEISEEFIKWGKKSIIQKYNDPVIEQMTIPYNIIILDIVLPIIFIISNIALFLIRLSMGI